MAMDLKHLLRTSVTLTWAPPESVEGSPITRWTFYLLVLVHLCSLPSALIPGFCAKFPFCIQFSITFVSCPLSCFCPEL